MPEDKTPNNDQIKRSDEYRKTSDFVTYYSNNVRFDTSAWDLLMTFGELAGNLPDGGSLVEQKIAVRMSWSQAKVMAIFLAINVATHEETLGVERLPEFVFGDQLKHLGNTDLTLEQMFGEIIKAFGAIKPNLEKS
jgi:hypothetical protein